MTKRTAIAGAGMTGAFLYRLLKNGGMDVDIYDCTHGTACGITPCAWGTSTGFAELLARAGLAAERYLLRRFNHVIVDGARLDAELFTFDKPRLIKDLLGDVVVNAGTPSQERYDRIIDATGTARALLPPVPDDLILNCNQYLLETGKPLPSRVKLVGIGYAWCFPLGAHRYHVGCGSLRDPPAAVLHDLGWLREVKVICGCSGAIRLTGPHRSLPLMVAGETEIIGIGEAIGCVAPLVGDGIVPGMRSALLLFEQWNDPRRYQEALLGEFQWMADERGVVDVLMREQKVGVREAKVLLRNSRRMQMQLRPRQAVSLLRRLVVSYFQRRKSAASAATEYGT